jgi:Asp-tRNA(Asn)/Glu-tRNA(Gln) amidotransferase A subunit family amidase
MALVRTQVWDEASDVMRAAVETALRAAERAGAKVKDVGLPPILVEAYESHPMIQSYETYRALAFEHDYHRSQLSPILTELLDRGAQVRPEEYDAGRRIARRARNALADLMAEFDVILTPSAPGTAPASLKSTGPAIFNRLWTLMGAPCVNVPGLHDASGLPLGVQIVGRFGRDRAALEAALFLEAALEPG